MLVRIPFTAESVKSNRTSATTDALPTARPPYRAWGPTPAVAATGVRPRTVLYTLGRGQTPDGPLHTAQRMHTDQGAMYAVFTIV
jgi:hypothetical protein